LTDCRALPPPRGPEAVGFNKSEEKKIEIHDQHLRREKLGSGICKEELPSPSMKVSKRIGVLNNDWQEADKLYRGGKQSEYEHKAIFIYGLLRETWERALEEVLLDGTVERYRANIQTGQIGKLSDISDNDCEQFDAGMTKFHPKPSHRAHIPLPSRPVV